MLLIDLYLQRRQLPLPKLWCKNYLCANYKDDQKNIFFKKTQPQFPSSLTADIRSSCMWPVMAMGGWNGR